MDPLEGAKRAMAKNLRAVPGGGGGFGGVCFGGFGALKRWGGHRRSLTSKIFFFDFWGWKFQR